MRISKRALVTVFAAATGGLLAAFVGGALGATSKKHPRKATTTSRTTSKKHTRKPTTHTTHSTTTTTTSRTTTTTTTSRPTTTTTITTTTSRPTTSATTPTPTGSGCFAHPSACGYPDLSNTGVPAGTALTPSGRISAGTGAVISGKDVTGEIEVSGNNVTIQNTRVTNHGDTSSAIHIDSGVTGTRILNSTLRGQASTNAIQYAVSNSGSGTVAQGLQMYNCSECWSGVGTLKDSYAISNGVITGAHYEAAYIPGGTTSPTDLEHNTMLNPNNQTAGIFGDNHAWGPMHNVTINNNLVAAGGDNGAIVTGCNGDGDTNIVVTNNRLSYAYDASMFQGSSNIPNTTWTNNYRDDTLKPIAASSSC